MRGISQSQKEVGQVPVVVPATLLIQAPFVSGGWRSGPGPLGADTWGFPTQRFF